VSVRWGSAPSSRTSCGGCGGAGSRSGRWSGRWPCLCRGSSGSCVRRAASDRCPSVGEKAISLPGEREEISRGIAAGLSGRVIADRLGRSSSTVSREIDRNGGRDAYRAVHADAAAYDRARRPKPSKLATNPALREQVSAKLVEDWSPQQIAARLRLQHPDEPGLRVSHETIYRDLYMPSRQVFAAGMFHRLRSEHPIRRPRRKMSSHGRGRIKNMVSIHARPVEADAREVAGHWESQCFCQAATGVVGSGSR